MQRDEVDRAADRMDRLKGHLPEYASVLSYSPPDERVKIHVGDEIAPDALVERSQEIRECIEEQRFETSEPRVSAGFLGAADSLVLSVALEVLDDDD